MFLAFYNLFDFEEGWTSKNWQLEATDYTLFGRLFTSNKLTDLGSIYAVA